MANTLRPRYQRGKVQIIIKGGGGTPQGIIGAACEEDDGSTTTVAFGYSTEIAQEIPPNVVSAVVLTDINPGNVNALDQLYHEKQPKKELAIEANSEQALFNELQILFNWNGSLSNYFDVKYS